MKFPKLGKKLLIQTTILTTLLINSVGYAGAYLLTHNRNPEEFGLGLPRAKVYKTPAELGLNYSDQKISITENEWLSTWLIKAERPQGTIILFHGKEHSKSSLLKPAQVFHSLNYNIFLVDFRGAGDSSGNTSTVGYKEGEDVSLAVNYIRELHPNQPVILYGVSMGSAAILKAIADNKVQPDGIILELPFARLVNAVKNRLTTYNMPSFILGELIVLWGGIQHRFNGFKHNPIEYTKNVTCPTLIFAGENDPIVAVDDVQNIFNNLQTQKRLVIFSNAGHQLLVKVDQKRWQDNVASFFASIP